MGIHSASNDDEWDKGVLADAASSAAADGDGIVSTVIRAKEI
jgi:hypothetical protein